VGAAAASAPVAKLLLDEMLDGLILAHPRAYPRSKKTIGIWVRGIERVLQKLATGSTENLCEWLP
jgi:hypothetical protein